MKIQHVLIDGGTHGNELNGIYLVKKFQQYPELVRRSSFTTSTLLGNPKAIALGRRYVDRDLNRCFDRQLLLQNGEDADDYEIRRAREIEAQFGQASQQPVEMSINLHNTTANMGLTLILDQLDRFTLNLAAYVSSVQPGLKLYHSATSGRNQDSLRSIAQYGVGVEVGPVSHGTLHAELFQQTEAVIGAILDYIEQINGDTVSTTSSSLTVYQYLYAIDYPRDAAGKIRAMIHPQLQFKDYEALHPGDFLFLTFDGEAIAYQGDATVFPVFINESAYYEKGIAMCLTAKQQFSESSCIEKL